MKGVIVMAIIKDLVGVEHQVELLVEFINGGNKGSQYLLNGKIQQEGDVTLFNIATDLLYEAGAQRNGVDLKPESVVVMKTYDIHSLILDNLWNNDQVLNLYFEKDLVAKLKKVVKEKQLNWGSLEKSLDDFIKSEIAIALRNQAI